MFKLLTAADAPRVLAFCAPYYYGAALVTRYAAYGCDGAAQFWYAEDERGEVCAAASRMDGVFTAVARPCTRAETLAFGEWLGGEAAEESLLLSRGVRMFTLPEPPAKAPDGVSDVDGENLKTVMPLLTDVFALSPADAVYTDLSHKLRHALIHGSAVFRDGRCLACAFTSGESPVLAVVGAVASDPGHRGEGHAAAALGGLCAALAGKRLLLAARPEVQPFYEKSGWKPV